MIPDTLLWDESWKAKPRVAFPIEAAIFVRLTGVVKLRQSTSQKFNLMQVPSIMLGGKVRA